MQSPRVRRYSEPTTRSRHLLEPVVALARKSFPWMSATGRIPTPLPWSPDDDMDGEDEEEKEQDAPGGCVRSSDADAWRRVVDIEAECRVTLTACLSVREINLRQHTLLSTRLADYAALLQRYKQAAAAHAQWTTITAMVQNELPRCLDQVAVNLNDNDGKVLALQRQLMQLSRQRETLEERLLHHTSRVTTAVQSA
ncbi:hypothetical protein SPRG_20030 [Saprolegnia parasitica CBS 223.65]|uniref:Uncharacterized protein n=1 Tax=Saprolegnia parasitica (strain CBS 223.65) TaxID=695850 RepID=A0A067CPT6_SAPPC|nr:hypothetical protein SPRG_20030 [Saprolegnia parasitica CBS 223.65]KDO28827.1 hypothetical protein SPRG_20030 [Saprolegnia parasitica CBS 223.65]|eukprot:XP_012200558.1 hypothetical protein SPRG_20030 [Saprolegnia parasitica CBS 223.65]